MSAVQFSESEVEEAGLARHENLGWAVFDAEFRPSEVLFHLEPESYCVYLVEFEPEAGEEEVSLPMPASEFPGSAG